MENYSEYDRYFDNNFNIMATYYFSSSGGNDGNNSVQAQSSATPWATITKFNATVFSPGDTILFKRGDTFRGVLNPAQSGASGNVITIGAYGTGANPIITAFTQVTSWSSLGGNIWGASVNSGSTYRVNMVLINGIFQPIGRYPNTGWYTISSASGNNPGPASITGNMPTTINWASSGGAGVAELTIRKTAWIIDHDLITAQSGSTINYTITAGHGEGPFSGYGYFVQNDVRACDLQGEWMHDKGTSTMKMYSTTNPSSLNVEAATATAVMTTGRNYLTFENIVFQGGNRFVVELTGGTGLTFNNCTFKHCGRNGVAGSATNTTLYQCTFTNIMNDAVYIQGNGSYVGYNKFYDIGMVWGMASNDNQAALALLLADGTGLIAEWNELYDVGYNGIVIAGNANGAIVRRNYVHDVMKKASDGGGIYTNQSATGKQIYGNSVTDVIGDITGTNHSEKASVGIYCDDNSSGIIIYDNYIARTDDSGIYFHNANNIEAYNNTVVDCVKTQYKFADDNLGGAITNFNFHNNVAICRTGQLAVQYYDTSDKFSTYGTFQNNIYNRLDNQSQIIAKILNTGGGYGAPTYYSISGWQSAYSGKETGTLAAPAGFVSTDVADVITRENNTMAVQYSYLNGIFKTATTIYSGTTAIPAYTGYALFKTGTLAAGPTVRGLRVVIQS